MRESGHSISLTSEEMATRFTVGFDHVRHQLSSCTVASSTDDGTQTIELMKSTIETVQRDAQEKFSIVIAQVDTALGEVVEQVCVHSP